VLEWCFEPTYMGVLRLSSLLDMSRTPAAKYSA
jgi:hypothetical protein